VRIAQETQVTSILDIHVNETSYAEATNLIRRWAQSGESKAVYATSVHGAMEAHDAPGFREILNRADLITPDGMPLVWVMRLKGARSQQRTYGPTLMLNVIEMAARDNIPIGLYGGAKTTLEKLVMRMKSIYPDLMINYAFSPPFRPLNGEEMMQIKHQIITSGARILFVGLGCPRQEHWIDAQRGAIPAVMIGVGAAFDFHAGVKPQAPAWMQKLGLEWLFRLLTEPRRLWKRYLYHIPRFLVLAVMDVLGFFKKTN
jgi:N-acetylglucosaminyldiphosphoundecaprenol N-acetyl-beta-D-mannosaminyltransferase